MLLDKYFGSYSSQTCKVQMYCVHSDKPLAIKDQNHGTINKPNKNGL